MMKFCYLNVTIGVLSAVSVAIVGVVALLVTAQVSIGRLEQSAEGHAVALGVALARDVGHYVQAAEAQAQATARRGWSESVPTDHPTARLPAAQRTSLKIRGGGVALQQWSEFVLAQALTSNMSMYVNMVWFVDEENVLTHQSPLLTAMTHEVVYHTNISDPHSLHREFTPYVRATQLPAMPTNPNDVRWLETRRVARAQPTPEAVFRYYMAVSEVPGVEDTPEARSYAARYLSPHWLPTRFTYRSAPESYRVCLTRLYNSSYALIGMSFVGISVLGFAEHLDTLRATKGSRSVVLDEKGYLMGASDGRASGNYSNFIDAGVNSTTVVALYSQGCTSTDLTQGVSPADFDMVACQHHATNFEDPAVRAVARTGRATVDGSSLRVKAGGEAFYVAVTKVRDVGMDAFVVAVVPEVDILGNVRSLYVIAGIVTAGVVVASSAAIVAVVFVSLRPLKGIAERMGKAARLEDDSDSDDDGAGEKHKGRSMMAEIAALEDAFSEMACELNRIRAFVPQSLLKANVRASTIEAFFDDCITPSDGTSDAPPIVDLSNSVTYDESCSRRSRGELDAELRAHVAQLLPGEPTSRRVTVLFINTTGFHAASDGQQDPAGLSARVAAMAETVLSIVNDQRGVVDSFHGDRFMVTFNAAAACAGHVGRAVLTALRVKAALTDGKPVSSLVAERRVPKRAPRRDSTTGDYHSITRCSVTCGISSGTVLVGNLGCRDLMRFSVIGPVVSQAAALERLCKVYTAGQEPAAASGDFSLAARASPRHGRAVAEQSLPLLGTGQPSPRGVPERATLASPGERTAVLVPQWLFEDLATCAVLRTVDLVRLPAAKRGCLVAAVEAEVDTSAAEDQEWLYQLRPEATGGGGGGGRPSSGLGALQAELNAAWASLAGGDREAAVVHLKAANRRFAAEAAASLQDNPRQPPGLSRLAEAVTSHAAPTEATRGLGVFYSAAMLQ